TGPPSGRATRWPERPRRHSTPPPPPHRDAPPRGRLLPPTAPAPHGPHPSAFPTPPVFRRRSRPHRLSAFRPRARSSPAHRREPATVAPPRRLLPPAPTRPPSRNTISRSTH